MHLNIFLLIGNERYNMISLQQHLHSAINQLLTNPNNLVGLLVVAAAIISSSNRPKEQECPKVIVGKRLRGEIRSLKDRLGGSQVANGELARDRKRWRSVAEAREKENSSLKAKIRSISFYQHQLERELLNKSRHRH